MSWYMWKLIQAYIKQLLLYAHALFPDLSEGLTCLQCKNVATPRECIRVTQCQAGEVCTVVLYVRKTYTLLGTSADLNVVYNMFTPHLALIWPYHDGASRRQLFFSEGIWFSDKTLECWPRYCEFDPLLTLAKITKRSYVLNLHRTKWSRVSVLYTGHVQNLVCHVWCALQYPALWFTNRN